MRRWRAFAGFWLLASLAPLLGEAPADFLQRLRARILQSQPFRVDFVQQVFVDEELTLEESGVIVFVDREHVKWEYLDPESKVFILEKDRYRFYDRENNQLLTGRLGERNERLIWELLLSERPENAGRWDAQTRTLYLRLDDDPDTAGARELKIVVGADFMPLRVEQVAENEVAHVYLFRNYRSRVALSGREFLLELPADVEIIEEQAP